MMKEYEDSLLKNNNKINFEVFIIVKREIKLKNKKNQIYINANIFVSIIFLLIIPIIAKNIKLSSNRLLQLGSYEIIIKVNHIGNQEILYNGFNTMPDKILSSNGKEIDRNDNKINIEDKELYYILKWDY